MNPGTLVASSLINRRRAVRLLALALASGLVCWYLGADVPHAILLGVAVTVVTCAALSNSSPGEPRDLWWPPEEPLNDRGARDEIARLAQSLGEGLGTAGLSAEVRVRLLVRRRLARDGLDLNNRDHHPEIVRRLGKDATRAVLRENIMGMRTKTLLGLLDALDADHERPR